MSRVTSTTFGLIAGFGSFAISSAPAQVIETGPSSVQVPIEEVTLAAKTKKVWPEYSVIGKTEVPIPTGNKALPADLGQMFPVGRTFHGVVVPSYTGDKLESVLNSKTVYRVDEEFLILTDLVIEVFDSAQEKPDTIIRMEKARYHLVTGLLTSESRAYIEQEKFNMSGDRMTFHSETHQTKLEGNVRVLIADANEMGPSFSKKNTPNVQSTGEGEASEP